MQSGLGPTILINLLPVPVPRAQRLDRRPHGRPDRRRARGLRSSPKLSERRSSPLLPVLACVAIGAVALVATYFEAREKVGL